MTTQELELTEIFNYVSKKKLLNKTFQYAPMSAHSFKSLVKYASSLRDDGTLDEEQFSSLLMYACALFVEREVEERMKKVLGDKMPLLFFFGK